MNQPRHRADSGHSAGGGSLELAAVRTSEKAQDSSDSAWSIPEANLIVTNGGEHGTYTKSGRWLGPSAHVEEHCPTQSEVIWAIVKVGGGAARHLDRNLVEARAPGTAPRGWEVGRSVIPAHVPAALVSGQGICRHTVILRNNLSPCL